MKYNLQQFDNLIGENNEEEEVNEIIKTIKETAFRLKTDEELMLFIQNHYTALLEKKSYESLYEMMDKVLYFIETHFSKFVDEKLQISDLGKIEVYNSHSNLLVELREEMKLYISEKLRSYMRPLIEPEACANCTIYQARYISKFWENWFLYFEHVSSFLKEETVLSYLISQNFNPPNLFEYIVSKITGELNQDDDPYIQEEVLRIYNKRFSNIPTKIGNSFLPDYPDVKTLLERWLKAEIKQCRKKQKEHNPDQQTIIPKTKAKIEMSLSVAQMAYFFKLLSNAGIITNKINAEMLNVICDRFRSKKMDTISYESLYNKYYDTEDKTKEMVKEILEKVIKSI